jgi:hypothetical protein
MCSNKVPITEWKFSFGNKYFSHNPGKKSSWWRFFTYAIFVLLNKKKLASENIMNRGQEENVLNSIKTL